MLVIRDSKLFEELKKAPHWDTLFSDSEGHLSNHRIPYFAGELDRIEIKSRGIYFYDTGCNGRDNSFVIRREKSK